MNLPFSESGWADFLYWQEHAPKVFSKVLTLINDTRRPPSTGLGKPEPLKHEFRGYSARRITESNRMIYRVEGDVLEIIRLRFHDRR